MSGDKRSINLYRALSAGLAVVIIALWLRGPGVAPVERRVDAERPGQLPATRALALRQLRASAASYGISEEQLIAELRAARTVARVTMLCERLGFVGTDRSLDALTSLADDRRTGVPDAALAAIGKIGTTSAVRFLLAYERDGVPRHRDAAIKALGNTGSADAKKRLTEIALVSSDPERMTAIIALADIGGADVTETLAAVLATGPDYYTTRSIIRALSSIDQPDAQGLLLELAQSSDPRVRVDAIDYLEFSADEETRAVLLAALASPDAEVAGIAAKTLARQGVTAALPAITELALRGPRVAQIAAIEAIGILAGDGAHDVLAELLETGTAQVQSYAASGLAELADADAIDILVVASARERTREAAISALRDLRGPAIEIAMLEVARRGRPRDRTTARQYLVDVGNRAGLELVIDAARNTAGFERSHAIATLADIKTEQAAEALRSIAASASGDAKMEAIAALIAGGARGDVKEILADTLSHGDRREMSAAAASLVKLGDEHARETLLDALKSGHGPSAEAAAAVALELDGGDEMRAALIEAAAINPDVRVQVIEKLLEIDAPEGLELARGAMATSDSQAINVLARSESPEARVLLEEAATSGDASLRAEVASALSYPESPEATRTLERLARDEDPAVRENALSSLGSVASDDAVDVLLEVAGSDDERDRKLAIEALGRTDSGRARRSIADLIERGSDADSLAAISAGADGGVIARSLLVVLDDLTRSGDVRRAAAEQLRTLGARVSDSQALEIERLAPQDS